MTRFARTLLTKVLALSVLLWVSSAAALGFNAATVVDTPQTPPPNPASNDQRCLRIEAHRTSSDAAVRAVHFARGALSDGDALSVTVFQKDVPSVQDPGWVASVSNGFVHLDKPAMGSPALPASSLPPGVWIIQACIPSTLLRKFGAQTADLIANTGGSTDPSDQEIKATTAAARLPVSAELAINEVSYDSPGVDSDEFVELENEGNVPQSLAGYALALIDGTSGITSEYARFALPNVTVPAGGRFVICGNAAVVPHCDLDVDPSQELIRNGIADAIALYSGARLVDSMSYGGIARGYTEGSAAPEDSATVANLGLSRCPNGSDSNDNGSDYRLRPSTPGTVNDCGTGNVQVSGDLCPGITSVNYSVTLGPDAPFVGTSPVSGSAFDLIIGGLTAGAYHVDLAGTGAGGRSTAGNVDFAITSGVTSTVLVGFACSSPVPAGHPSAYLLLFGLLACLGAAQLAYRVTAVPRR